MEEKKESSWIKTLFWIALISSYATYIFSPLIFISLPFWLVIVFIFFRRRIKWRWYLLAFSFWSLIPVLSFVKGTIGYLTGDARLSSVGYPMYTFYNLDNEYRVYRESSGCIIWGLEPFTQTPNNFAITSLTSLFGYQRGTYTGFYPDQDEAEKIIETSEVVPLRKKDASLHFSIDNKKLIIIPYFHYNDALFNSCDKVMIALVKEELIIIRPLSDEKEINTYLADMKTGKIFACYRSY